MEIMRGRPFHLALAALCVALIAAACGGDNSSNTSTGSDGSSEENLSGSVVVSGSSTVEPISAANAQKFTGEYPDVDISVDGPGTGDGFALFCKGETDISDASRPIEEEEAAICDKAGIEYIELKIGIDGITVMTSPNNDAVDCLDFHDLYALLGPESEGFKNWSDANDLGQEIGAGHVPYPDAPLDITGPGEESGTYDSFGELALKGIAVDERKQPDDGPYIRPDYQASANDNVIVQGVEGSDSSLGWVGFAYYEQNAQELKALQIDNGDSGCVEPTTDTIQSGDYPLSRDLYFYVNKAKAEENEAVKEFVGFYLSDEGLASVTEVGYVAQPDDVIQNTQSTWDSMTTGTQEG